MEILLLVGFGIRHGDGPNIRKLSTLILAAGAFKSENEGVFLPRHPRGLAWFAAVAKPF